MLRMLCEATNLIHQDGELYLIEDFLDSDFADLIFHQLQSELVWHEEYLQLFGRRIKAPRLVCWYGDSYAVYTYSGVPHKPLPWTERLLFVKQKIEAYSGYHFNSVLANCYRDGQDSMGWHADKEQELGPNPVIASMSFGGTRRFKLRHNRSKEVLELRLSHNSLLLMAGAMQHHWRHAVPKEKSAQLRINLTFRYIININKTL